VGKGKKGVTKKRQISAGGNRPSPLKRSEQPPTIIKKTKGEKATHLNENQKKICEREKGARKGRDLRLGKKTKGT